VRRAQGTAGASRTDRFTSLVIEQYRPAITRGTVNTWLNLTRAGVVAIKKYLFIIARRDPATYETMKQSFGGHADIGVILDRRRRERRWQTIPIEVNRRARERRAANIDALLRQLGWVVVEQRADEA
jgi:hypothetical protein